MQEDNIAVKMVRPDLDDLPSYETPSPFSIRRYVPGDEQAWRQIHASVPSQKYVDIVV